MQTKTRFWRNDALGALGGLNMVGTDTAADRIWNTSILQPDPQRGMLHTYMADPHAREFASIPAEDRVACCVRTVSEFLPQLPAAVEAAYVKVWQEDPWQLGAIERHCRLQAQRAKQRKVLTVAIVLEVRCEARASHAASTMHAAKKQGGEPSRIRLLAARCSSTSESR